MTAPVYLYPNDSAHSEQCLLGTINVVIPLKGNCTENKNLSLYQEYITFIAYNRFPRIETLSKIIGTRNRR